MVSTTVYLADVADFAAVNEVYARRFAKPYPARATIQAAALPLGVCIQISALAVVCGE